jgi:hypothetical protein
VNRIKEKQDVDVGRVVFSVSRGEFGGAVSETGLRKRNEEGKLDRSTIATHAIADAIDSSTIVVSEYIPGMKKVLTGSAWRSADVGGEIEMAGVWWLWILKLCDKLEQLRQHRLPWRSVFERRIRGILQLKCKDSPEFGVWRLGKS